MVKRGGVAELAQHLLLTARDHGGLNGEAPQGAPQPSVGELQNGTDPAGYGGQQQQQLSHLQGLQAGGSGLPGFPIGALALGQGATSCLRLSLPA